MKISTPPVSDNLADAAIEALHASDVLSPEAAAEYLGVTTRTLTRWVEIGRLPQYKLGPRLVRYKTADLDAMLEPVRAGGEHVAIA